MLLNNIIKKADNGYFAHISHLKGCVSQGKTYEETLLNIKKSAELYLESLDKNELILEILRWTQLVILKHAIRYQL